MEHQELGKTTFCSILANLIKNKKILIIDFDIFHNNINTIFGVNKENKKLNENNKKNIQELIIKINKNIDLISRIDFLFDENYEIKQNKIKEILSGLSKKYNLIIIDTPDNPIFNDIKKIIKNSDSLIFLTEPNLLGMDKSKKILEKYINKWEIEKEKINIVFNKYNNNSIYIKLLKQLFVDFNILSEIKLNKKYDLIINSNLKIIDKEIKNDYIKIIKKLNI